MTLNFEIPDGAGELLDEIASAEKRSRRSQAAMLMEDAIYAFSAHRASIAALTDPTGLAAHACGHARKEEVGS